MASYTSPPVADESTITAASGQLAIKTGGVTLAKIVAQGLKYPFAGGLTGLGTGTKYHGPNGASQAGISAIGDDDDEWIAAEAGTLGLLRIISSTATGAGDSVEITIMVNGVASTLTATIPQNTAANTLVADTTHFPAIAAGDRVKVRSVIVDAQSHKASWSFFFIPTTGA